MQEIRDCIAKHRGIVRPSVMWFWNDRLDEAEIVRQIGLFRENGIDEFYIHPLWGLECDGYLSDRFMRLIRLAMETARANGMRYSIYDEYDWPSGSMAGELFLERPETRQSLLRYETCDMQAGEPASLWFRGEFLGAYAEFYDKAHGCADVSNHVRMETSGDCTRLSYENVSCTGARLYAFYRCRSEGICASGKWASFSKYVGGALDAMSPEAVGEFLRRNNGRYDAAVGDEYGRTVRRLFTDETHITCLFDLTPSTLGYTEKLPEEFRRDHGYPLSDAFVALASGSDDDAFVKARYDYNRTCTRLFRDAYMRQYAAWCHERGILFTGHLSGEGFVYSHTHQMGDFYETISEFDIPGIDNILSKLYMNDPEFALDAKLLASVAKFAGKDYTMCETFSGSGWDMTLEEAKRIAGLLILRGVNYIVYMGAYYSLAGGRKTFPLTYPPSHGWNNPLFAGYGALSDYIEARCALSAETKPCGRALLMLPQIQNYVHLHDGVAIDFSWRSAARALLQENVEFDVFFEPLAGKASVKDGVFFVCGYGYDTVVAPHMQYSSDRVFALLSEFAEGGGRVAFIDRMPYSAADSSRKVDFSGLFGQAPGAAGEYGAQYGKNAAFFRLGHPERLPFGRFAAELADFVGRTGAPFAAASLPKGMLLAQRSAADFDLCFLMNDTDSAKTVELALPETGTAELLHGAADVSPLACFTRGGEARAAVTVQPHDLVAVVVKRDGAARKDTPPEAEGAPAERRALSGGWRFEAVGGNLLPLKVRFLAKDPVVGGALFDLAGKAGDRYAAGEFPAEGNLAFGDAYAASAAFDIDTVPETLELFAELGENEAVYINGRPVAGFEKTHIWGVRDHIADIRGLVKPGRNVLVFTANVPAWRGPHRMASMVLRGSFRVENGRIAADRPNIEPGAYTAQGYPYFSGTAVYRAEFTLEDGFTDVRIAVDTADLLEVAVNGRPCGKYLWRPYLADITACCHAGKNALELRLSSTYAAAMTLESIELVSQGVVAYRDAPPLQRAGLLSAPALLLK